jgi:hypothetical protein
VQSHLGRNTWSTAIEPYRIALRQGQHPLTPFHWEVEFPEVFVRKNDGFDAIVGNPPFAGKNTIIASNHEGYLDWLKVLNAGTHGNADLVAHFFRRAFGLLRKGGTFGLIATNTIGQGDTRATGLSAILSTGGSISRAVKRLSWPGQAAVIVSVIHVVKAITASPILDGRQVSRISAYVAEGDIDKSPAQLMENAGRAFIGAFLLGMGFTFDDTAAAKGEAETIEEMEKLIEHDPRNKLIIKPYLGGEELMNDPQHRHHRYVIDFDNMPLARAASGPSWASLREKQQAGMLRAGIVSPDYPLPVAMDWPDLIRIVEARGLRAFLPSR